MGQRKWTAREVIALLLVASMTSSACSSGCRSNKPANQETSEAAGRSGAAPGAPAPAQRATVPPSSLTEQGAVGAEEAKTEQALKGLLSALKSVGESLDSSTLDVQARQSQLGAEPKALTSFVSAQIGYGRLCGCAPRRARDTAGAFRQRNDRAMLLAELLRAAGRTIRFARGELSPSQAEQLVRRALIARGASVAVGPDAEAVKRAPRHSSSTSAMRCTTADSRLPRATRGAGQRRSRRRALMSGCKWPREAAGSTWTRCRAWSMGVRRRQ